MGRINFFYVTVYIGRFDYSPFFYFGPKHFAIKENCYCLWKSKESACLCRVSNQIYCPTFSAFLVIFEGHVGLKNLVFRRLELLLSLEKSWMSDSESIFENFKRSQKKNWCYLLKSVLKVGKIMWTLNYILF